LRPSRPSRPSTASPTRSGKGENEKLLEAIADEKVRRIRTGQQKRERSQHLIAKAPAILDSIACDVSASPRHRVDAIKTLNDFSSNGPEGTPASDRFQITIVLNGDVERFDKSIEINANDTADPHSIGSAPPAVAAITKTKKAKNKLKDNDDGDAI
jgi:hypothetical protein